MYKQTTYGFKYNMMDDLIQAKTLPESFLDFTIDHFLTFDIEVVQKERNGDILLSPISIGVGSTFDDDKYFERQTSESHDGYQMVSCFMEYLESAYYIYLSR